MNQTDLTQQITRILTYIATPLLIKWGIDEGSATAIIGGGAALVGALAWWAFWARKKTT